VVVNRQISSRFGELETKPLIQYGLLAAITLLAAVLRFYKLGDWSFWIDEIFTINHAQAHFSSLEKVINHIPPTQNWIPLSVIFSAGVINVLGISEWSVRLVSVAIGTLSIPILYFPYRKVFGIQVTLIALLLLAISPWHIFWSQNARFYTSLLLFYTLALAALYFGIARNRLRYFVLFFVLLYLAFSERIFTFFIVPVIAVYLIVLWLLKFEKPPGLNLRNIFILSLPIIVGGLIELYSWITNGVSRFFGDFDWFFLYRNDDPIRLLGNISFNLGVPLIVLAIFSGIFLLIKKNHAGLLMLSNAVVPMVILIAANPFIFTKDRYVFVTLFSWVILAAYGVNELFKSTNGLHRWLAVAVLMILFFDAASDSLLYFRVNYGHRGEWKTAFNIIKERGKPEDAVVAYWPEFGPHYLGREVIAYEDIDVATVLNSGERYWFVIDAETIWANKELYLWLEDNARLIDIRYLRTPDDFYLRIYHFDPKQFTPP
jgi:4-amino-4-deoxy-L-arabinose transferase-like glycosyltransferase